MTPQTNNLKRYPVDRNGNLMDHVWNESAVARWVDNLPFEATLTLKGISRGRSAANFDWVDEDGGKWPMFMVDMLEVAQYEQVDRGEVSGAMWRVRKRGANYGIALDPGYLELA